MAFSLSSAVNEEFKMMGLSLKGDAMAAVVSFLERAEDANASLSLMLDALDARSLTSSIVDKQVVDETTRALDRAAGVTGVEMDARGVPAAHGCSTHDPDDGITIVDAFEMPKFAYDAQRRTFYEKTAINDATRDATVDAEADSKIELYRERFKLLQQRISRHRMFTKPSFECGSTRANETRAYCELTPLTGLLGAAGETRYVMGCLSQLEDDRFFLEDLTGTIQIDLSNAATSSGLFTENCIVVAEGEVRVADGVFEARALGFPPAESREESAIAAAHRDFFGAGRLRPADIARLLKSEATSTSDMFVVMSDVWLDRAATFRRLRAVFEGFDSLDAAPAMFVLMGDFCSKPCHLGGGGGAGARAGVTFKAYARGFDRLASLIEEFPRLREECRWVFVPGPGDPGVAAALPRPALRRSTLGRLPEALPRATFASNPARVRYKSQDLVFMRENLQSRMRRACVLPPTLADAAEAGPATPPERAGGEGVRAKRAKTSARAESDDARFDDARDLTEDGTRSDDENLVAEETRTQKVSEWERRPLFKHLAATLVQQAHLAPLPIQQAPVFWEHDHALRLYPAPHCVVLGDRGEQQALAKFEDTELVNPGSFADDGSFAVYRPATRETEFSAAP